MHKVWIGLAAVILVAALGRVGPELEHPQRPATGSSPAAQSFPSALGGEALGRLPQVTAALQPLPAGQAPRTPAGGVMTTDSPLPNGPAPVVWHADGQVYRAVHFISAWDARAHRWTRVSPDLTVARIPGSDGFGVDGITAVSASSPVWYAGTLTGRVLIKGADGTWRAVHGALPPRTITAVLAVPGSPEAAVVCFGGYGTATPHMPGHVYASADRGGHWWDLTGNLPDDPVEQAGWTREGAQLHLRVRLTDGWFEMVRPRVWHPVS